MFKTFINAHKATALCTYSYICNRLGEILTRHVLLLSGLRSSSQVSTLLAMERVICLHVGVGTVTKMWRFDVSRITDYTCKSVKTDLIQLFPDIARKGLKLRMWYVDELAGEVSSYNCK